MRKRICNWIWERRFRRRVERTAARFRRMEPADVEVEVAEADLELRAAIRAALRAALRETP